jgi:hypothetical protein
VVVGKVLKSFNIISRNALVMEERNFGVVVGGGIIIIIFFATQHVLTLRNSGWTTRLPCHILLFHIVWIVIGKV